MPEPISNFTTVLPVLVNLRNLQIAARSYGAGMFNVQEKFRLPVKSIKS